ncbi:MAG: hypothetical protein HY259_10920 [Chloroflexi bacterium]|nr:hypothetical protein [Chloroflexota bacterium]
MDKPLPSGFTERLIELMPTPTAGNDVHYYFVGGTVAPAVNVMVHVTVLDDGGAPVIGVAVVDQSRDGSGEIRYTDGGGRVTFLYRETTSYTQPDRGAHTVCIARDAVMDDATNMLTFVPLSTKVDGLGQARGGRSEFHIQFRAMKTESSPTLGSIRGSVALGAGKSINLVGPNVNVTAMAGTDGSFGFDNVPPATYVLTVAGTGVSSAVAVLAGQQAYVSLAVPAVTPADMGTLAQQVSRLSALMAKIRRTLDDAGF